MLVFCLLVCLATDTQPAIGQQPLLVKVGAYANHPKIYKTENSKIAGFWPELLGYIARREHWYLEYVWGTWPQCLERLSKSAIDIMPDVAYTKARSERYLFSKEPVLMSWSRVYVHKDENEIESIRDLDHKTVAALKGSVNLEGSGGLREIVRNFNLECTFLELENYDQVFKAVEEHRADAGITNRNYGNKNAGRFRVKNTAIIFQPINVKFAFPLNGPLTEYLSGRINYHIHQLKQDPNSRYFDLIKKYFETGITEKTVEVLPPRVMHTIKTLLVVLALLALAALLSRIQVRRQVRKIHKQHSELQVREKWYREILNSPNDAIFIHDAASGAILDVNRAMLDMYGYTRKEALQLQIEDASCGRHPYTSKKAMEFVQRTIEVGPQTFEWLAKRKNGEVFWVEVSLKHTKINKNDLIIAVVRDITERKKAQEELLAEKERLAVTLASIGDGVIATDIEGRIELFNKVAARLTGWPESEALGRQVTEVFQVVSESGKEIGDDPVSMVLNSGQVDNLERNVVLIAKDGRRRVISDSGAPILNSRNRVVGVVLVFRDVTGKRRLEREILKNEKLRSVGLLAGGIAHDFNNILMAILGNINLSRTLLEPGSEAHELLQEAENACMRARDLTSQLLTFAKGGEPVKQIASLANVIRESAAFVTRGSNVSCVFDIAKDLWLADVDTGQMSQVVQNLVLNARQAMPKGGKIKIACHNVDNPEAENFHGLKSGKYIKITISDQGVGIPHKYLETIFDPYFSTKQEGDGLGLAIVHSVITKHGGFILVNSHPGKGTIFTIYLPAAQHGSEALETGREPFLEPGNKTVMIMDDDKMVLRSAEKMLMHLGYKVKTADDGRKAVWLYKQAMASRENIDIVILDLTIPGGSGGIDTAKQLIAMDPDVKLIVSSGYSNDPVMANYQEYGFKAALAKPFDISTLKRTMAAVSK